MSRDRAVALVSKIAKLEPEETPTIERLLKSCPELARSDWINRFGPASAWSPLAKELSTPNLEWVIRVLVIVERELGWMGGSVAAGIWLFRAYQERPDGDADGLAEWVLRHRGNNYLPFGSMTSACSLAEWRAEQSKRTSRRLVHEYRLKLATHNKAERIRARQDAAVERRSQALRRKERLTALLGELQSLSPAARLLRFARDESIPLGALPNDLIVSSLEGASALDEETREALLRRVDRRQAGAWKELRRRLVAAN